MRYYANDHWGLRLTALAMTMLPKLMAGLQIAGLPTAYAWHKFGPF